MIDEAFIHELSFGAGYRYSDYDVANNSFSTDTYKFAGFFAPVRDIRFRGGYNRAVRAPNVHELFSPQSVGARRHRPIRARARSAGRSTAHRRPVRPHRRDRGPVRQHRRRTRPPSITA